MLKFYWSYIRNQYKSYIIKNMPLDLLYHNTVYNFFQLVLNNQHYYIKLSLLI